MSVPATGLERRVEIDARRFERRRQTEQNARENRHAKRECEDASVETDRVDARNVARIDGANRAEGERGDQETGHATHETEQRGLGEELPHETPPICPERNANGDLLLP